MPNSELVTILKHSHIQWDYTVSQKTKSTVWLLEWDQIYVISVKQRLVSDGEPITDWFSLEKEVSGPWTPQTVGTLADIHEMAAHMQRLIRPAF